MLKSSVGIPLRENFNHTFSKNSYTLYVQMLSLMRNQLESIPNKTSQSWKEPFRPLNTNPGSRLTFLSRICLNTCIKGKCLTSRPSTSGVLQGSILLRSCSTSNPECWYRLPSKSRKDGNAFNETD